MYLEHFRYGGNSNIFFLQTLTVARQHFCNVLIQKKLASAIVMGMDW